MSWRLRNDQIIYLLNHILSSANHHFGTTDLYLNNKDTHKQINDIICIICFANYIIIIYNYLLQYKQMYCTYLDMYIK